MKTSFGKRTGGIFGVLRILQKELKTYNYFPIVVFDGGLSKRRLSLYSNYKRAEEREEKKLLLESNQLELTQEELFKEEYLREYKTQQKELIELLRLFGIPTIRIEGWEGDDLLYALVRMSQDSIIVSDDKDMIQLLHEPEEDFSQRVRIRKALADEFLTEFDLQKQGINIQDFIYCKAINGDPSDNIPGACNGVGEKTALGLCKLWKNSKLRTDGFPKTAEDLDKRCKELNIPKRSAYINFKEDQFLLNYMLMDLSLVEKELTDSFIDSLYNEIIMESIECDEDSIQDKLVEYEIKTFDWEKLVSRVLDLKEMLKIENKELVKDIIDINKPITLF